MFWFRESLIGLLIVMIREKGEVFIFEVFWVVLEVFVGSLLWLIKVELCFLLRV